MVDAMTERKRWLAQQEWGDLFQNPHSKVTGSRLYHHHPQRPNYPVLDRPMGRY